MVLAVMADCSGRRKHLCNALFWKQFQHSLLTARNFWAFSRDSGMYSKKDERASYRGIKVYI